MSRTSTEVKKRYNNKVYDRITLSVPKEMAAKFREKTQQEGKSMAGVLKEAIQKYLKEE